jgi:hypothetical protein
VVERSQQLQGGSADAKVVGSVVSDLNAADRKPDFPVRAWVEALLVSGKPMLLDDLDREVRSFHQAQSACGDVTRGG